MAEAMRLNAHAATQTPTTSQAVSMMSAVGIDALLEPDEAE